MSEPPPSSDAIAPRLRHERRKTALVLCDNVSRRLAVRRSLEAQGFVVARARSGRDLAMCKRVYMPQLVVIDGPWLEKRPGVYGVIERIARQIRVEVVDLGAARLPRDAHPVPGTGDG